MKKLIQFELRKIFSKHLTQAALLAVLFLSVLLNFSTCRNMYAFDGISREGTGRTAVEIDKSIAKKYDGILTDEKIRRMMSDFAPKSDLHGLNAAYLYQNAMQSAVFSRFSDINGNWNGATLSDVFGEEELRIGYTEGWLQTSRNMVKIFIALSLVIITMTAPVFSSEYGGMDNIILTARYGKSKCAGAKITAGILSSLFVTAAISALNLALALALYGSDGLDCSILFASTDFIDGYIPFNITCGALLIWQVLLAFTGAVSITGITLLLSAVCKSQTAALAASAACFLFPVIMPVSETSPLFRYIALLPLYHAQFISLMSIEQMHGGILYAILAVPAAFLFLITGILASRKIFTKHQVS